MHESMIVKLDKLQDRLIEIQEMLATPEVVNDIENNKIVMGYPAVSLRDFLKKK